MRYLTDLEEVHGDIDNELNKVIIQLGSVLDLYIGYFNDATKEQLTTMYNDLKELVEYNVNERAEQTRCDFNDFPF